MSARRTLAQGATGGGGQAQQAAPFNAVDARAGIFTAQRGQAVAQATAGVQHAGPGRQWRQRGQAGQCARWGGEQGRITPGAQRVGGQQGGQRQQPGPGRQQRGLAIHQARQAKPQRHDQPPPGIGLWQGARNGNHQCGGRSPTPGWPQAQRQQATLGCPGGKPGQQGGRGPGQQPTVRQFGRRRLDKQGAQGVGLGHAQSLAGRRRHRSAEKLTLLPLPVWAQRASAHRHQYVMLRDHAHAAHIHRAFDGVARLAGTAQRGVTHGLTAGVDQHGHQWLIKPRTAGQHNADLAAGQGRQTARWVQLQALEQGGAYRIGLAVRPQAGLACGLQW